jgi:hypothetical protein
MKKIYKIIFLFLLPSVFCTLPSFSQTAPGIEWQNTIGGSDDDELWAIQQTADGGYILGGASFSNISGDKTEDCNGIWDYWIVKTDASGNIQWQNTIGGSNVDVFSSLQQTADGGYILGGYSYSNISGDKTENSMGQNDYWMVKTDSSGNIQWQNTIGGSQSDVLHSLQQTKDGGYILGGWSDSNISGDKTENCVAYYFDYWIIKTDSSGNIQWQNTIGGNDFDMLYSIHQTVDGGYILGGGSNSNISGDKTENCLGDGDYWIVKTDSSGNIEWQNTIGGNSIDQLSSVQQTADGGYILAGLSISNISGDKTENSIGDFDYWIIKTDSSGNIQWQRTIGGNDFDDPSSVQQTVDGGYIVGGKSRSNISGDKTENSFGGDDLWIVKINSTGSIQWQKTIGGNSNDWLHSFQQTAEGGYILGGCSWSTISGDKTENNLDTTLSTRDYWIVKLFPDSITGIPNLQSSISNLQFFPNPLSTQSKLTFKNHHNEKFLFTLYDITGRITESVSTITNEIILTKGSKQPGVYLFNLMNEKNGERMNGKIVISD